MSDVVVDFIFRTSLTQKEFSVVTRALAGHQLKEQDLVLARDLNERLLKLRLVQVREYAQQAARALEVAEAENRDLQVPENQPNKLREESTRA